MSSFHFLPLESIQNHSPGLYCTVEETAPNFRQRSMSNIG